MSLFFGLFVLPVCAQTARKPAAGATSTPVKKVSSAVKPAITKQATTKPANKPAASKQTASKAPAKTVSKPAANKQTATKTPGAQAKKPTVKASDDKKEFEVASAIEGPAQKIAALKKFVAAFPESTFLNQARELLSSTAYATADERFAAGDIPAAKELYKLAASSAPTPISTTLFNESLSKIPNILYWRGDRSEAIDIAKSLESRIGSDADQFAALAMFYVGIENGDEAVRLAEAAVKADPTKSKAYGVLGLAERVNFKLDESAAAYAKALELDPNSASLKRNLAEIKRATGKADEAVTLYRDAVAADANDVLSQNGLVLSLFDAGRTDEAEKALAASLEQNPNNVMLIAGAAYWYAAHKNDEKAIELARRAINIEPRYIWSHIALGRALMLQNRPVEAEEVLLKARAYGNFPTLEYEIASARAMAGFYRDAVEGLEKTFSVKDDAVVTRIGGRVERKGASFTEALADERKASILEPGAADDADTAARLKQLLILREAVSATKPDETTVTRAADAFVAGDDNSKYHRQLYASSLLLNNKIAVDKALEYAEAAVGNADSAVNVPNAGAFVMASELYDSRQLAVSRSEFIKVPDVPRPMLAAVLRGRIEDLIGWALIEQKKSADAEVHFKRAVAILPDKSAWWRAAMWRYGTALQADGKETEALDAYIKSYSIDKPDLSRYTIIETLYKKLNGSTEGLEAKIGPGPLPATDAIAKNDTPAIPSTLPSVTATPNIDVPQPTPTPAASPEPSSTLSTVQPKTDSQEAKAPTSSEAITPDTKALPLTKNNSLDAQTPTKGEQPTPNVVTNAEIEAKPSPEVRPAARPTPEVTPSPSTQESPAATPSPTPTIDPTPITTLTPDASPSPTPEVKPTPTTEVNSIKIEPSPVPSPTPVTEAAPTPTPTTVPSVDEVATSTPTPSPTPEITRPTAVDQTTVKLETPPATEKTTTKIDTTPTDSPTAASEPKMTPTPETVAKVELPPPGTPQAVSDPGSRDASVDRGKTELIVSSSIPLPSPSATPDEKSVAEVTKKDAAEKSSQNQTSSSPKPLFEPVIITIPKANSAKASDGPTLELNRGNADGRSRLVDGQPVQAIEPTPCQVSVSQDKLSLLNNGGTLAVLVGVERGESLADVKYVISGPADISVKLEPDINGIEGRSLYIITSTSERTGNYRVTFYLPCGKKDITITVR